TISPSDSTHPTTNQTVTASVTSHDNDGNGSFTLAYQWTVAGTAVAGATTSTLDLSAANHGDLGDSVSGTVTASDGTLTGSNSASTTVKDTAPVVTSVSISPSDSTNPKTNDTVTASATFSDDDGSGTVTLGYQWSVNNTAIAGQTASTFSLAPAGH